MGESEFHRYAIKLKLAQLEKASQEKIQGQSFFNRIKKGILLLFADVDGLKIINDTLGHYEGDQALIDTANILKETFRESDIIARIGGDEFVILAIETSNPSAKTLNVRLQEKIKSHNTNGSRRFKLSISIGIVCYNFKYPCTIAELVVQADKLMYEQKWNKLCRCSRNKGFRRFTGGCALHRYRRFHGSGHHESR